MVYVHGNVNTATGKVAGYFLEKIVTNRRTLDQLQYHASELVGQGGTALLTPLASVRSARLGSLRSPRLAPLASARFARLSTIRSPWLTALLLTGAQTRYCCDGLS